jgi:NAD(P)-dependent dehydrogenase (short-subunit alcohol dehydrogenase family)
MSVMSAGTEARPSRWRAGLGRLVAGAALLTAVAMLPWLSGNDPALTVLRARSADQGPTPEQLAAVREQLGLDEGPFTHLAHWLGGLPQGDAGTFWVSGEAVLPQVTAAFAVSFTLMLGVLVVTIMVAALVSARTLYLGSRRRLHRGTGAIGVGLIALVRGAAIEWASRSIRVNVVAPGLTMTPIIEASFQRRPDPDAYRRMREDSIPLRRLATPEEVADAVLFLACPESSYITGAVLPVDGGYTAF